LWNLKITVRSKYQGLYKGIIDFKKGYQSRTDVVKDEKGDFVTDFFSIVVIECTWG